MLRARLLLQERLPSLSKPPARWREQAQGPLLVQQERLPSLSKPARWREQAQERQCCPRGLSQGQAA